MIAEAKYAAPSFKTAGKLCATRTAHVVFGGGYATNLGGASAIISANIQGSSYSTVHTWLANCEKLIDPAEVEFQRQKEAFQTIPPLILAPYQGKYIVSRDGLIVDSDDDINVLTERFFRQNGNVSVYITKIGGPPEERMETPFYE